MRLSAFYLKASPKLVMTVAGFCVLRITDACQQEQTFVCINPYDISYELYLSGHSVCHGRGTDMSQKSKSVEQNFVLTCRTNPKPTVLFKYKNTYEYRALQIVLGTAQQYMEMHQANARIFCGIDLHRELEIALLESIDQTETLS